MRDQKYIKKDGSISHYPIENGKYIKKNGEVSDYNKAPRRPYNLDRLVEQCSWLLGRQIEIVLKRVQAMDKTVLMNPEDFEMVSSAFKTLNTCYQVARSSHDKLANSDLSKMDEEELFKEIGLEVKKLKKGLKAVSEELNPPQITTEELEDFNFPQEDI